MAAAPTKPATKIFGIGVGTLLIAGAGVGLVIAVVIAAVGRDKPGAGWSEDHIRSFVIESCQGWAKEDLKDPDSARFGNDWKAQPGTPSTLSPLKGYDPAKGHKLYRVTGSLNAKNSFGGYVGSKPILCNVYFDPSDESANGKAFEVDFPG